MKIRSMLAAVAVALVATLTLTTPALAATYAKGYHIRNHPDSTNEVQLYKNTTCTGYPPDGVLYAGENALSSVWLSFDIISDRHYFVVKVYDDKTGAHIVTRTYQWYDCVKVYGNSYLVVVKTR